MMRVTYWRQLQRLGQSGRFRGSEGGTVAQSARRALADRLLLRRLLT